MNGINHIVKYLSKHRSRELPMREGDALNLPGDKVKGSRLDAWRLKGQEGGLCDKCQVAVERLTVDHIVPLIVLAAFDGAFNIAANDEENFQFLCEICNRRKGSGLDMRNPKTAQLLAKYIQPYLPLTNKL